FNAIALVDSQGIVQSKYYKIHLFTPMRDDFFFKPGSKIKIIQTKFGIIGLSICYDLRFPEIYRLLAHKGAEIILCPAQWPCPRQEHWDILLRARSIENQLILVGVNRIGETESNSFCGGSGIIDPWGNPLLKLPSTKKGVFSVEISRELVQKIRKDINYLDDAKLSINL
ncbi:MAG: nitrilase-related carbon-nitrogen hydrolase, partial [Promethearchaeota archaeon]